jgi:protein-S-isoprenylcysteine O-methyltransferase Ste14
MYARLARREEQDVLAEFGDEYRRYIARTPAFLPRLVELFRRSTEGR